MLATVTLYLDQDDCFETQATVLALREGALAFDRTCFYPGGGGQPADTGQIVTASGQVLQVKEVHGDAEGILWHVSQPLPGPDIVGETVRLAVDRSRRLALTRYHTVLHVLNTIALRDYGGWITGVQIGPAYSRIDFKLEGFSAALCTELEGKVNAVLAVPRPIQAYYIPEEEFRVREDLLRTLEVKPPIVQGRVRVVEIVGFDAQACGGTHVESTLAVGKFSVFRTENKGKINKRLYVRLDEPSVP
jgi:misacylated tRNA(Ala) deacylase